MTKPTKTKTTPPRKGSANDLPKILNAPATDTAESSDGLDGAIRLPGFSVRAHKELLAALGEDGDEPLVMTIAGIARMLSYRPSVGSGVGGLRVADRTRVRSIRKASERALNALGRLTPATRNALRGVVGVQLMLSGRESEAPLRFKPAPHPEAQLGHAIPPPDRLDRICADLNLLRIVTSALENLPGPPGRPPLEARETVAIEIGLILAKRGVQLTKTRDGRYAKVLEIALSEIGETLPREDMGRLLRRCVDQVKGRIAGAKP